MEQRRLIWSCLEYFEDKFSNVFSFESTISVRSCFLRYSFLRYKILFESPSTNRERASERNEVTRRRPRFWHFLWRSILYLLGSTWTAHKRRYSFRSADRESAFHPAKASVGEPRRRYFCKCMVTACAVWKGTSYYFGNKNSPADLFADLICDLDRERYLWPVDISGTTRSRICMLGWINTRVEFSLAKTHRARITLACSPREF